MTIHEASQLLSNKTVSRRQLLICYQDLCKEYGYIQGMSVANLRDLVSGRKTLAEMQLLIDQLTERLE